MLTEHRFLYQVLLAAGAAGVVLVFLFQDFLFLDAMMLSEEAKFILRKVLRVLLNDVSMLLIIIGWFRDREVARLAIWIQAIDLFVLLPLYLVFKVSLEGTSEISTPALSQLHRLIINPTLMILLIPAVYFQRYAKR